MPVAQVRRSGSAPVKRASIDGVQLSWQSGNDSVPKNLPAGPHVFQWYVEGPGNYGFRFLQPGGIACVPSGKLAKGEQNFGECPFNL